MRIFVLGSGATGGALAQLLRRRLLTTPSAYAAAECAAAFIRHWPRGVVGVLPPEALPRSVRQRILADLFRPKVGSPLWAGTARTTSGTSLSS